MSKDPEDVESARGSADAALAPSRSLLAALRAELATHAPFASMAAGDIDYFIARSSQCYYAPGQVLVDPVAGPAATVYYLRRGTVQSVRPEPGDVAFEHEPGDLFPLGAALGRRPVRGTYTARGDVFVLQVGEDAVRELASRSAAFALFLEDRLAHLLQRSREALRASYASQALIEQSLEAPLAAIAHAPVVTCGPEASLAEVFATMERLRIGAMVVAGPDGRAEGILTRQDVLGRVVLPGVPLDAPVARAMVAPVHTLDAGCTANDAALAMARLGIRHLPVTRHGRLAGMVSERDLFALQRRTLHGVAGSLRSARDVAALRQAARDIRSLAKALLGQGVHPRQLTALVSHLNDVLTRRLIEIVAAARAFELTPHCWLALGSEGRSEQTIATDQDNALLLDDGVSAAQRDEALGFARAVNEALAECGYPLCSGGIMAGEAACCLTASQWGARFEWWIGHGAPGDLLDASIFFDFRPLAGRLESASSLRRQVAGAVLRVPRFLKQLALNALERPAPLDWFGSVDTDAGGGVDIKLRGTALFVDAARIHSLAAGVHATNTRERLMGAAAAGGLPQEDAESWAQAFEFLQLLRLRLHLDGGADPDSPNRQPMAALSTVDRGLLKASLRQARSAQQRLALDYAR